MFEDWSAEAPASERIGHAHAKGFNWLHVFIEAFDFQGSRHSAAFGLNISNIKTFFINEVTVLIVGNPLSMWP